MESNAAAVRDLLYNAERAGVAVARVDARAADYLAQLEAAPDFVLLDPPRDGIGKEVVRRLAELKPAAIVDRSLRSRDSGARPGRTDWRGLSTRRTSLSSIYFPKHSTLKPSRVLF